MIVSDLGLISTVIPAYNYGRFVCEAVDSVLRQTYRGGLEVVVVDDGSTDDTRARLAPYGDRIRYVHQPNRGLPGARNTGIHAARGEWIGLLDADDVIHPQLYEVLAGVVARTGVDLVSSGAVHDLAELAPPLATSPAVHRVALEELFWSSPLSASGTLVRKAALLDVGGFDETLRAVEDRDMWLRLAVDRSLAVCDEARGYFYRLHPGQMNRDPERMRVSFERVLEKFFAEHPAHAHHRTLAYGFLHLDTAICWVEKGGRREATRHLLRSLRLRPWMPASAGRFSSVTRLKILARLAVGERVFRLFSRAAATR